MRPFTYVAAPDGAAAVQLLAATGTAKLLAGGTNLIDLMKEDVEQPTALVDITRLSYAQIQPSAGGLSLGALARNTDTANHPLVRQQFPLLTQAILAGASAQIRNMATTGGNLNQRTRCSYFYDVAMPCNKRQPGTGCGALGGINRMHAIFGWSDSCVAVHPSDMCVALAALDAVVKVQGPDGSHRAIPFARYHRLPGSAPHLDNTLAPNELITSLELPANKFAGHSHYLKLRDRASYAFALLSVAVALELDGNQIKAVRIALGGVAHKPWRAEHAEKFLVGKDATEVNFQLAAQREMQPARPLAYNKFKVALGQKAIVKALVTAASGTAAVN